MKRHEEIIQLHDVTIIITSLMDGKDRLLVSIDGAFTLDRTQHKEFIYDITELLKRYIEKH